MLPFVMMGLIGNSGTNANLESMVYLTSTLSGIIKCICIFLGQKKLGPNINAAIDDWLSLKDDEIARKIMRKCAHRTRILTIVLLYSAYTCLSIYILSVVVINVKQIFFMDSNLVDADTNVTGWKFLIPSGLLSSSITGSQYVMILIVQSIQTFLICATQCLVDSFFFNVATHLAGQLEILKHKFKIFANKRDTETNYRKKFVDLINRHNELMEFNQNLEDTFHFLILCQLVMVTIMIALLGLRINLCLNENNQFEATKSSLIMNYLLMQSLVYTYSGDFLQRESEDIFCALYATSWFTLPVALMKDLHFAMMRSSIPFRLTGGKFFYVNRETIMCIIKTAASYVSVLRIALKN
ncbi:uncharacterized protein LOC105281735 isoform X2 [Ooceraea biroi]|nr:uncharacterized protein LOC105281735 isoform X2 [Ooceraea biroi]